MKSLSVVIFPQGTFFAGYVFFSDGSMVVLGIAIDRTHTPGNIPKTESDVLQVCTEKL